MNLSFFTSSLMQFKLLGQEDAAATTDAIFNMVGNTIYTVLAVIALWGAFCVLMVWRRVAAKRFKNEKAQNLFPAGGGTQGALLYDLGIAFESIGRFEDALKAYQDSVAISDNANKQDAIDRAREQIRRKKGKVPSF